MLRAEEKRELLAQLDRCSDVYAAEVAEIMRPITSFFTSKSTTAKEKQVGEEVRRYREGRKLSNGDSNGNEKGNNRSLEVSLLIQNMVQQGKGDSARRSKEEAAKQLRDISRQLRLKGELMPLGKLRKAAHWSVYCWKQDVGKRAKKTTLLRTRTIVAQLRLKGVGPTPKRERGKDTGVKVKIGRMKSGKKEESQE